MPWEARLQFLQAVFFTFSGVGFLLDLANPSPGRTVHIVFLVFMGGAIGVVYGFCFMRAPKLLPVLVAVHVVLALVLTPIWDRSPWTGPRSLAPQPGLM